MGRGLKLTDPMKKTPSALLSLTLLAASLWPADASAVDPALERRILRRASGLYGPVFPGSDIPTGFFEGKVGYDYHEHSAMKLTLKPGHGESSAVLNVWAGSPHIVRLDRITAKVKPNGNSVVLSGGRLKGSGLLPYGVRLNRAGINAATVKLTGAKESLEAPLGFAGIDLSNLNAPVSGMCVFTGEQ
jgi:hypothetical protein